MMRPYFQGQFVSSSKPHDIEIETKGLLFCGLVLRPVLPTSESQHRMFRHQNRDTMVSSDPPIPKLASVHSAVDIPKTKSFAGVELHDEAAIMYEDIFTRKETIGEPNTRHAGVSSFIDFIAGGEGVLYIQESRKNGGGYWLAWIDGCMHAWMDQLTKGDMEPLPSFDVSYDCMPF